MKAKYWFITRGNLSAQDCLKDIMLNFKIDDYETKVSFVKIEKLFDSIKEAKIFDKKFVKWCWSEAGAWHKESDMTVSGIMKFVNNEWEDIEEN